LNKTKASGIKNPNGSRDLWLPAVGEGRHTGGNL
jgi:hypothetical protein